MEKRSDKDRDGDRVLLLPDDFPHRNSLQFYGLGLLGRRWPRSMTITFLFILLPIRFIVRDDCKFLFRSELRFKNCETSLRSDYSSPYIPFICLLMNQLK